MGELHGNAISVIHLLPTGFKVKEEFDPLHTARLDGRLAGFHMSTTIFQKHCLFSFTISRDAYVVSTHLSRKAEVEE